MRCASSTTTALTFSLIWTLSKTFLSFPIYASDMGVHEWSHICTDLVLPFLMQRSLTNPHYELLQMSSLIDWSRINALKGDIPVTKIIESLTSIHESKTKGKSWNIKDFPYPVGETTKIPFLFAIDRMQIWPQTNYSFVLVLISVTSLVLQPKFFQFYACERG